MDLFNRFLSRRRRTETLWSLIFLYTLFISTTYSIPTTINTPTITTNKDNDAQEKFLLPETTTAHQSSTQNATLYSSNFTISHDLSVKNLEALLNDKELVDALGGIDLNLLLNNNETESDSSLPTIEIPYEIIEGIFQKAEESLIKKEKKLAKLWEKNLGADSKSPVGTAYAFTAPNEFAIQYSNNSKVLEIATKAFLKSLASDLDTTLAENTTRSKRSNFLDGRHGRFSTQAINELTKIDVSLYMRSSSQFNRGPASCGLNEEHLPCDPRSPYPTFSGWCNNLKNPSWGKSVTTFDRMLPPAYEDGVSIPRSKAFNGGILPYPRYISSNIHIDSSHLSNRHTLMFMQYAQFLDHDITHTPVNRGPGGTILNCRDCESYRSAHPECWPIKVPTGDGYYPHMNQTNGRPYCIPFSRSLAGQQNLGPRDQINQNSAYIDSSQIYGENVCKASELRSRSRGQLNVTGSVVGGKPYMPQISYLKECKSRSGYCFSSGDPRASEQPALAAVHTVFLREHNRMAEDLSRVNPHWDDDKLYFETRRIMNAMNQHIAYHELLPRLLGPGIINEYGLGLQMEGYYNGYDPSCRGIALNEFATAAFRFGHSLIRPNIARMDNRYNGMNPHIPLRDGFFDSDMLYKPLMIDEIVRGLIAEPMEQLDPFVTNEITNHLFEDKKKAFSGLDLISLNIHRGRDHGLPSYNEYRQACGLQKAVTFSDLLSDTPPEVIHRLQSVYSSPNDIDLFTGSLVERPVGGGLVGPTIACIIGTQFQRLRRCDRFWYETSDTSLKFTEQQLAEIRKMTLSKIICDNLDMPSDMQIHAFDAPHRVLNPRIPCDRMSKINLQYWKDFAPQPPVGNYPNQPADCIIGNRRIQVGSGGLSSPCTSCICTPEGAKCASLKITSCHGLMREAKMEEISKDKVCMEQCGFLMGENYNQIYKSRSFQNSRINLPFQA